MMLDKNALFSDAQSIAAVASTLVSDFSYDLGTAGTIPGLGGSPLKDIGRGARLELLIEVIVAVTSAGSATVQFQLVESANADLSSPTVVMETPAIAKATLVAGYMARLAIPPGITGRYIGMQYVIGAATTTAGTVTAGLVAQLQTNNAIA